MTHRHTGEYWSNNTTWDGAQTRSQPGLLEVVDKPQFSWAEVSCMITSEPQITHTPTPIQTPVTILSKLHY